MKKVLYLSYDGMTDPLGQGQVLSYLSGLSTKGHQISLISFEKKDRFKQGREAIDKICAAASIDWHPLSYTKSPPLFSTLYDVNRMITKAGSLQQKKGFDIVHCRSYLPSLAGLPLKKKNGSRFIFDMRGFWIDEKSEGTGGWNPASPVYGNVIRYLRKKEKEFYAGSDCIVTLTHAAAKVIQKEHPSFAGKISVIPTCVNLDLFPAFSEEKRMTVRQKLGIPNEAFVLLYSGGTGHNYDTAFLAKAFDHIKKHFETAWLLVLSKDGVEDGHLKNGGNVTTVSVPYQQVSDYLMAGDLGVVNYANGSSVTGRSPTKLGEYWASGLPAISPAGIGDVEELFGKYKNSGWIIRNNELGALSPSLLKNTDRNLLRQYAIDYFGLPKGIESYDRIYNSL
jgi:glycosyltransferase involved in cell wall biosynthesis